MWLWHSLQLYSRLKYSDIYSLNYYSSILHYITHVSLQNVCYQFSQGHNFMTTSFILKNSSCITIPILRSTFYLRVKSNQNVYIRCDHGIVYSYNPGSRAFRVQTYTRSNIAVRFCITSHMYFHVYIPHDCISMCLCNEIFIGANMQDQGSGVLCVVAAPFKMVITQCKPSKPQSTACRLHLALTRQRIIESPWSKSLHVVL